MNNDRRRPPLAPSHTRPQWRFLVAALVAPIVVVFPPAADPFGLPKLAILAVLTAGLVGSEIDRVRRDSEWWVPTGPYAWALLTFVAALWVSALLSDSVVRSLLGPYDRYTGALPYTLVVVLGLFAVRDTNVARARGLLAALALSGALVACYAILQVVDADPLTWQADSTVVATLGNPNFVAGFLGIAVPILLWHLLDPSMAPAVRAGAAMGAAVAGIAIAGTGSLQGVAAAGIGCCFLLGVWATDLPTRLRLAIPTVLTLLVAAGLAIGAAGVFGVGPLDALADQRGIELRRVYWGAAVAMAAEHPVTGVGVGDYESYYRSYRPDGSATKTELAIEADAAHSVPLELLATGGALLAISYLAAAAFVVWALVRGLRAVEGSERRLLGAFGAAWIAFVTQAAVSIDVPGLASLFWALGGAVVALAGRSRTRVLPVGRGVSVRQPRHRVATAVSMAMVTGAVAWLLWADVVAGRGGGWGRAGNPEAAAELLQRAVSAAPWQTHYRLQLGRWLAALGSETQALATFEEAARQAPRELGPLVTAARLHASLGHQQAAQSWYQRARDVEPSHPELASEYARFLLSQSLADRGRTVMESSIEAEGGGSNAWLLLARLRLETGDRQEAVKALQRAVDLDPQLPRPDAILSAWGEEQRG